MQVRRTLISFAAAAVAAVAIVPAAHAARQLPPGPGAQPVTGQIAHPTDPTGLNAVTFPAGAESIIKTKFDPKRHGFDFANYFGHDLGSMSIPGFGSVDFGGTAYGLCGGMSYAALDTFLYGGETPDTGGTPPGQGSDLRGELWDRQVDTLTANGAEVFRRFVEWQLLPIKDQKVLGQVVLEGLETRSKRQYRKNVKPKLLDGRPVPLGLVNVDGTSVPWKNHQLLAIGSFKTSSGKLVIAVYDPNYPAGSDGEDDGITWLYAGRRKQYHDPAGTDRVSGKKFRGYFATKYSKKQPSWVD
jgi:hypothetical protein